MAAHRYWRVIGLVPYDGGTTIEISEFHLLAGTTRVDASATLTSSIAPTSGTLASLSDNATSTLVQLAKGSVLTWDLGSGGAQDVTDIRIGAGDSVAQFPVVAQLQWSDDNVSWSDVYARPYQGIVFPGKRTKTSSPNRDVVLAPKFFRCFDDNSAAGITAVTGSGNAVVSGRLLALTGPSTTDCKARFSGMPSQADVLIEFVARFNLGQASVVFRTTYWGTGNDTYGYVLYLDGTYVGFGKGTNSSTGGWTPINVTAHLTTPGDLHLIRVEMIGNAYRVWIDNRLVLNGTDNTYSAAGDPALRSVLGTGYYQSFSVTDPVAARPQIDTKGFYASPSAQPKIATAGAAPACSGAVLVRVGRTLKNFSVIRDTGVITGVIALKGTPVNTPGRYRVRLYRDRDGALIQEVWSDPVTGRYTFTAVDTADTYSVIGYWPDHGKRAVISDGLPTT